MRGKFQENYARENFQTRNVSADDEREWGKNLAKIQKIFFRPSVACESMARKSTNRNQRDVISIQTSLEHKYSL